MEEIALLNTTLSRPDGARLLFPNIVMSTLGVVNIARSGPHCEFFVVRLRLAAPHRKTLNPNPGPRCPSAALRCTDDARDIATA